MKSFIIAAACLIALTASEPPPSNSYLPPSPGGRSNQNGYPRGGPQIARNLDHDHGHNPSLNGNPFGRSGPQSKSKFGNEPQGYDRNASPFGRNGLDDINSEPANYNFGYNVADFEEGTDFGHHEERQDERAEGQYHVVLPDGRRQTVNYEADERGFKPQISYEDADSRNGGYDSNSNNIGNHGNGFNGRSGNQGNHGSHGHGNF